MQKTDVALIRVDEKGINYTKYSQPNQEFREIGRGNIKHWNMRDIAPQVEHFKIPNEHYDKFITVLKTKEGKAVVNNLKNQKTNRIINEFLENEHDKLITERKKMGINPETGTAVNFINELHTEDLRGYNCIREKTLNISKEDIYNEFIAKGLLKF